jgi:hypothetical protein
MVSLTSPAPAGGAIVTLSNANPAATVPSSITVPANATSIAFSINTSAVAATSIGNISASYNGVTKSASLTVNPVAVAVLSTLTLSPTTVRGGVAAKGTVTLTASAPAGGFDVSLFSSSPGKAAVPASVKVLAGSSTVVFNINTTTVNKKTLVTITASAGGISRNAQLTIVRR